MSLMDAARWFNLGKLDQLDGKQKLKFAYQGVDFVVFWVDVLQLPVCFVDRCSHQDVKLSDFGSIGDTHLVCLAHGARFQLPGGQVENFPACDGLKRVDLQVDSDVIYASLDDLSRFAFSG